MPRALAPSVLQLHFPDAPSIARLRVADSHCETVLHLLSRAKFNLVGIKELSFSIASDDSVVPHLHPLMLKTSDCELREF